MNPLTVKLHSKELTQLLMHGQLSDQSSGWVANQVHNSEVVFEQIKPTQQSNIYIWFKAIRAISLTATFMPALAVLLWLIVQGYTVNYFALSFAVLGLLLLQVAVNLFNDVGDYLKLIDLPTTPGGSGVIQAGWLTTYQVKTAAVVCLILGSGFGIPALVNAPLPILICGLLAVIGVLGYSGKPFNFKYRAMGDVFVFLLCGPILTIGLSYAALGQLAEGVVFLGAYFGFAATTILNANNISDITIDSERGATTFASVLGFRNAIKLQVLYYVAAYASLFMLVTQTHLGILLPLLLLPLVYRQIKTFLNATASSDRALTGLRFEAAKLHLLMGILLCVVLLVTKLFMLGS